MKYLDTKYASTNLKTNCHTQPTSFLYRSGRLLHEVLSNKAVITFMRSIITNVNNFFYCFISNFTPQNKLHESNRPQRLIKQYMMLIVQQVKTSTAH